MRMVDFTHLTIVVIVTVAVWHSFSGKADAGLKLLPACILFVKPVESYMYDSFKCIPAATDSSRCEGDFEGDSSTPSAGLTERMGVFLAAMTQDDCQTSGQESLDLVKRVHVGFLYTVASPRRLSLVPPVD